MKITAKLAGAVHRHTRTHIRRLWLAAAGLWMVGASLLFTLLGFGLLAAPSTRAIGLVENIYVCDGHSAVATTVTTCDFAHNVAVTYILEGGPSILRAYSPATGETYTMQCQPGDSVRIGGVILPAARCVGGNNAVVWVF
ncbi:hypothetical protein [Mycobacterium mantenii]|uniref:hypothetical protein n=1 Tax=Mycobacterium mantenii TaxID=560555 RepID=UPI000A9AD1CE|nr:hypothetical protein [Mycobacterium mantenii]